MIKIIIYLVVYIHKNISAIKLNIIVHRLYFKEILMSYKCKYQNEIKYHSIIKKEF